MRGRLQATIPPSKRGGSRVHSARSPLSTCPAAHLQFLLQPRSMAQRRKELLGTAQLPHVASSV